MDMTISMFDAYYERMPAVRAERMMDNAQSAIYAQANANGRNNLWNTWSNIRNRVTHAMNLHMFGDISGPRSIFTWNGEVINLRKLRGQFQSMFGRRAVE